jgi:hypothetical protein
MFVLELTIVYENVVHKRTNVRDSLHQCTELIEDMMHLKHILCRHQTLNEISDPNTNFSHCNKEQKNGLNLPAIARK